MQGGYARRVSQLALIGVLAIVSCYALVRTEARQAAPRFTLKTLDGKTYNNASLAGRMVLLQFWATYCPYCRADQGAVDEIQRRYSGSGLVVLAVDEGEPAAAVSKYLKAHPRAVRVAVDPHKKVIRRFGKARFPYYVLIDRRGKIATTRYGAGSAKALLSFLAESGGAGPVGSAGSATTSTGTMLRSPAQLRIAGVPQEMPAN